MSAHPPENARRPRRSGKLYAVCAVGTLCLLTACGGQALRPVEPVETPRPPAGKAAKKPPPVVQKRGGAYYKDDGPADELPENLDDIQDAEPRVEPLHRFANRPYVVLGKSYVPNTGVKEHRERGIASWYGKKFHGQKTSIGEPYDMFAMTAAHPTLAIPSYARVTSVGSGRSVVVRVTDRGPFHAERIIDLSYAAAHRLGYVNGGSTLVDIEAIVPGETLLAGSTVRYAQVAAPANSAGRDEIELLAEKIAREEAAPLPSGSPLPARGVFLQLGAFASADNAESLRSHLARELDWLNEEIRIHAAAGMHRVHLGPFPSRVDAEKIADRIRLALGYKPTLVNR